MIAPRDGSITRPLVLVGSGPYFILKLNYLTAFDLLVLTLSVAPELILVVTLPTLVLVATAADHLVPDYQSNHCYYRLPLSTIPGISTLSTRYQYSLSTTDHISCIAPIAVIVTILPLPVSFPRVPVIE